MRFEPHHVPMKSKWVPWLIALFGISACNLRFGSTLPGDAADAQRGLATPSLTPHVSATPRPSPTDTAVPTATAIPIVPPDQSPVSIMPLGGDRVCRFGPGLRYGVGGTLLEGVRVEVTARNGAGDWFQFELPGYPGKYCWVAANTVQARGDLTLLAIVEAPLSYVTNVSVQLDPLVMEPTMCIFPMTFTVTFSIETIGPTFVTFRRNQSNGFSGPAETVEFSEAGGMTFEDTLPVDAPGEHWFRVGVIRPNHVVVQGFGTVVCP